MENTTGYLVSGQRLSTNALKTLFTLKNNIMSKKLTISSWLVLLFLTGISFPAFSQDLFTIYLVRHAEKEVSGDNPRDPGLTACGKERAESLANFLQEVNIDVVYSTDYVRTKSTAEPTAQLKAKQIELYNPGELDLFAKQLLEHSEDALIVGHSNTTGVLAGLLVGEDIAAVSMSEDVYHRIYQVVVSGNSKQLNLFQSAFSCEE